MQNLEVDKGQEVAGILEAVCENIGNAVCVRNQETGEILYANKLMREVFVSPTDQELILKLIDWEMPTGNGHGEVYYEEGRCWYDLHCATVTWLSRQPAYLYTFHDITEKKQYQKMMEHQTYRDFLTGLLNRMSCEKDLPGYIEDAILAEAEGALLYLDLDDFKHINEGLGHQYGDELLKAIALELQRIEGISESCYRMGGDEFVIIIPRVSYPRMEEILSQVKEIFDKPWFLKNADYYCTMSMGVAVFPGDGATAQELLKMADIALYDAKRSGRNRYARYTKETDSKSGKRLDMEKNMRDATISGYREFEIFYQPIIDLRKGGVCSGAEALIRWNSMELGFIPPSEFIPLAEYLGLINPIGNYVLMEAARRCKYWNDHGYPEYKVNVNLSVVQLLQPDIADIIHRAITETGINPQSLTLEVTESLAINDMARMKNILANIKKLGVRIALDDFGTGYSSLNHIREIPFDVIKVDQSFIRDLEHDAYSRSFIKMVVQLAEEIDVNICIEGVETKEQFRILADMNVGMIQGYYFDRPVTWKEFEQKYTPDLRH
ncbi:MAG: EAL domain-containing protein [Lachnospiraceae bacterium]|jgi:diguanylate cyclase (GGDEF)-like protein|nr:EAL domain-containing protein [Lachnospiraceae bacterium]